MSAIDFGEFEDAEWLTACSNELDDLPFNHMVIAITESKAAEDGKTLSPSDIWEWIGWIRKSKCIKARRVIGKKAHKYLYDTLVDMVDERVGRSFKLISTPTP